MFFKTFLKWALSLLIGAFFVWYSAKNWPLMKVFTGSFFFVPPYIGVAPFNVNSALNLNEIVKSGGWYFNVYYVIPFFLLLTIVHFLRVIRWYFLLKPIKKCNIWTLNRIGAVGFMAVFVFPFRLGEFVRPYLLKDIEKVRMSKGMATIIVERIMDGLIVSFILFIVLMFAPRIDPVSYARVKIGSYIAMTVFVSAILFIILLYIFREKLITFFEKIFSKILPSKIATRLSSIMKAFLNALQIIPDYKNFLIFVLITVVYWGVIGVNYNILAKGFGINIPLSGSFAMMSSVVVGMMIPNSPGNVGSFWVFFLIPLGIYGIGAHNTEAIAYALFAWGIQLLQYLIFAFYFILTGKTSFKKVIEAKIEEAA